MSGCLVESQFLRNTLLITSEPLWSPAIGVKKVSDKKESKDYSRELGTFSHIQLVSANDLSAFGQIGKDVLVIPLGKGLNSNESSPAKKKK